MKQLVLTILILIAPWRINHASSPVSKDDKDKTAIVIASFGTSYVSALNAITGIEASVRGAFPAAEIRHAFTSDIIRKIWHKRKNDEAFQKQYPALSKSFLQIKGPLATIADLQDEGYKTIIVQSSHIFAGEEYSDLASIVDSLNAIRAVKTKWMPFEKLVLGRPALGKPGVLFPYKEDIRIAAEALKDDVEQARKNKSALVYMGHGNEHFCTGAYVEFQAEMKKQYPDVRIFVGVVEGYPGIDDVISGLKHTKTQKVLLKPLMVVAGDHAQNDMAGDEEDSWKKILEKNGLDVSCVLNGLGENKKWADIYAAHIRDAMNEKKTGPEETR